MSKRWLDAEQLGRDAWLVGFPHEANPYQGKGIFLWAAWYHGWSEARDAYNGGKDAAAKSIKIR